MKDIILGFLLKDFDKKYSQSEIARKLGISVGVANKWCRVLEREKLLVREDVGKAKLYRAVINYYTKKLKASNTLKELYYLLLKNAIPDGVYKMVLFGSAARGEDDSSSDIDIMMVCREKSDEIYRFIANLKEDASKEPKVMLLRPDEYSNLEKADKSLWDELSRDGITIYGE